MEGGVAGGCAGEVVVEVREDVVGDVSVCRGGMGTGPFEFVAGVGPEVQVGVCVGAGGVGFGFGGEEGEGWVGVVEERC